MLFDQIDPHFFDGMSAELKANIGLVSASLKSEPKPNIDSLYKKIEIVEAYLDRQGLLGDIGSTAKYIKGNCLLKHGVVSEYASSIVFFGNILDQVRFGLIGSVSSLVGNTHASEAKVAPYYYTLTFLNSVIESERLDTVELPYMLLPEAIDIALKTVPQTTTWCRFTARVLHRDELAILATPLYVAEADDRNA